MFDPDVDGLTDRQKVQRVQAECDRVAKEHSRDAAAEACTHAAHAAADPVLAAILRDYYEPRFGWALPGRLLWIALPRAGGMNLPSACAWKTRTCCATVGHATCLRSLVEEEAALAPHDAGWDVIASLHSPEYIGTLRGGDSASVVADVFDMRPSAFLGRDIETDVLKPARRAVGGTVLAAALAIAYGGCVLADGGMHHASRDLGSGASIFGDTVLSYLELDKALRKHLQRPPRMLYIDLDVHLCDGVCHDVKELGLSASFKIMDGYNECIWPVRSGKEKMETEAPGLVDIPLILRDGMKDDEYLALLREGLANAEARFDHPDLIFYLAGMDVLKGDPLGRVLLSADGIAARDDMVLGWAARQRIPVVLLVGGGYSKQACAVARKSIGASLRKYHTHRGAFEAVEGAVCPLCAPLLDTPPRDGAQAPGPCTSEA